LTANQAAGGVRARGAGLSPAAVFTSFWNDRSLIFKLAKREVQARYRGSLLGMAWALLNPLLSLAVFTFVFSTVFQSRWDVPVESKADFALLLFAGLIVFWFFSDCVSRAPALMLENGTYIKRVVFPLEILPWVVILSSLFHTALSTAVLMGAYLLVAGPPPSTALLLPLVFVPMILFVVGLCWFLASAGVYLSDLKQIVPVLVMLMLFVSPIFYPISATPEWFRFYVNLNPLAQIIEEARGALFYARPPSWPLLALFTLAGWAVAWLGLVWFQLTRKGFADVI